MDKKIQYTQHVAFINRQKESKYLLNWVSREPNEILFIYGPKSSGKTTLINTFVENDLNSKQFEIKHFNLRKILILNFTDFIQAFFEIDYRQSKNDIKKKREYNVKVFKLSKEIITRLNKKELDPFVVMDKELLKLNQKGIRPIIIIDELQALEDIYMNGQRQLLKELFNFFVAMTKESHRCHVIIASSDGYFMNRIYKDSKLKKTSVFFEVNYLSENDTKNWLKHIDLENNISTYTLSDQQVNIIWEYIGGSMWEISNILGELLSVATSGKVTDAQVLEIIHNRIALCCGEFHNYAGFYKNKQWLFKHIFQRIEKNETFIMSDLESLVSNATFEASELTEVLSELVGQNFLSFHPINGKFQLQGKSMLYGLRQYITSVF
ncbi:MAG: AAA family ATPase [Candidatus Magnetomorum sp.]|nr:AAA family ATPase [Candidatus Magnetomorum sp.]